MSWFRWLAVAALAATIAFAVGVWVGGHAERAEIAVEDLRGALADAQTHARVQVEVAAASDQFSRRSAHIHEEIADATHAIEAAAGSDVVIAPELARLVVCRVRRLRGEDLACDAGADHAGPTALEPLPARAFA